MASSFAYDNDEIMLKLPDPISLSIIQHELNHAKFC